MRTNGHAIICAVLGLALGCGKAPDRSEPLPPAEPERVLFDHAADRLVGMLDRGFVVSLWEDGRVEHKGDTAIFSGIALGTLDCPRGALVEAAWLDMLRANDGLICRHPDLCGVKDPLLDSHLGFYWGVANRIKRCPESLETWREAFATHEPQNVPEAFDVVRGAVRSALGLGASPDRGRVGRLMGLVAGWAAVVHASKAAGYRVHLGLLSAETLEASGVEISASERDFFCAASDGMDLGTVDHWCGRSKLREFISAFQFDAWNYRHERARWESQDGKPGLKTPGLDLLVALRNVYAL